MSAGGFTGGLVGVVGVEEPPPPQADKESAVAITRESVFALREFMAFPKLTKINMIIIHRCVLKSIIIKRIMVFFIFSVA